MFLLSVRTCVRWCSLLLFCLMWCCHRELLQFVCLLPIWITHTHMRLTPSNNLILLIVRLFHEDDKQKQSLASAFIDVYYGIAICSATPLYSTVTTNTNNNISTKLCTYILLLLLLDDAICQLKSAGNYHYFRVRDTFLLFAFYCLFQLFLLRYASAASHSISFARIKCKATSSSSSSSNQCNQQHWTLFLFYYIRVASHCNFQESYN